MAKDLAEPIANNPEKTGIIVSGLEKMVIGYLAAHSDSRFSTANQVSLALGSNEKLVKSALDVLTNHGLVIERIDPDMDVPTYHILDQSIDLTTVHISKVVTPKPTVTEKDMPVAKGMSEAYWCGEPGCKRWFDTKMGRANHRRFIHGIHEGNITRHRSEKSMSIDKQIKKLYPEKSPSEIADIVGISYPSVTARLNKMHKMGEIKEYLGPETRFRHSKGSVNSKTSSTNGITNDTTVSYPPKSTEPAQREVSLVASQEIPVKDENYSFRIGEFLKAKSVERVAIVNMTLEVTDERGSEYDVTVLRAKKGGTVQEGSEDQLRAVTMPLKLWKDLADFIDDTIGNLDDDTGLTQLIDNHRAVVTAIRRDARIPESSKSKKEQE